MTLKPETGSVVVVGTFDTKADEFGFLRDCLQAHGLRTIMLDVGILGEPGFRPDIAAAEVADRGGMSLAALRASNNRSWCLATMSTGAAAIVRDLHSSGQIGGGICLGGGQGSSVGAAALHVLPVGIPKVMVSTIAGVEGATAAIVGIRDMTLVNSVVDISGLNSISRKIIANAAAALAGMVSNPAQGDEAVRRFRVATTMFGVTTPCVNLVRSALSATDLELFVFAATGTGDRAMEDLVEEGWIDGVIDITTSQVGQGVVRGNHPGGARRLEIAGAAGIPQVVSFGGLDIILCHEGDPLLDKATDGLRRVHRHTPFLAVVRPTVAESVQIGKEIARKVNLARGPTAVLIPRRGFSEYSAEDGPLFDPEADEALINSFLETVSSSVRVHSLDCHINDPVFADEIARVFTEVALVSAH